MGKYYIAHVLTNYYRPQTKLRKGNVFTSVCQSSCSLERGEGGCVAGGCAWWGVCVAGGMCSTAMEGGPFLGNLLPKLAISRNMAGI